MKRHGDASTRDADRHAFNALYGFRCDCARCISPADRAAKEALHRALRPRGEP